MALGHVMEGAQFFGMTADIVLIRRALQQAAGHSSHLGAGYRVFRPESAVSVAVYPAAGGRKADVAGRPMVRRNVRKALRALRQLFKARGNGGKLRPGHGRVGAEAPVGVAGDDAELLHVSDVVCGPVAARHIVEAAGIGLIRLYLLGEQAGEHGRHLGSRHVPLRAEGAAVVAHEEGEVVLAVELRSLAVYKGHGDVGFAVHGDAGASDGKLIALIGLHIALRGALFQQGVLAAADAGEAGLAPGVGDSLVNSVAAAVFQHKDRARKRFPGNVHLLHRYRGAVIPVGDEVVGVSVDEVRRGLRLIHAVFVAQSEGVTVRTVITGAAVHMI